MTIKLVALDMDGTLLNPNQELNPRVATVIRKVRSRGIRVVLCSGRPLPGIMSFLPALHLVSEDDYAIPYNGALIQNTATGAVLARHTLDFDAFLRLHNLANHYGLELISEDESAMYTDYADISRHTLREALGTSMPLRFRQADELPPTMEFSKFVLIGSKIQLDQVQAELTPTVQARYYIVRSEDYFLEFMSPHASKGRAVAELAAHLGITANEVLVMGDSHNDVSMFEFAGTGIAMGNAKDEVKRIATAVTATNADDGVAVALEEYIINQ